MKKFLRTFVMLALLAVPWITQAQVLTFDFEDGQVPAEWTNSAAYPWVASTTDGAGQGASATGIQGTYCLKSGNSGVSSSTSEITATYVFNDEGTISFRGGCWGEGSSSYWDHCDFYIDGERMVYQGADQSWSTYTFTVPAGSHTFKWSYTKDSSVNPAGDAFFIDNVVIDLGEIPACPTPMVTLGAYSATEATVSWTEVEVASGYLVTIKQGDEIIVEEEPVDDLTYTYSEFAPGTTYTIEVLTDCGDGTSNLNTSNTVTFTTLAGEPVSTFPYLTGFEDGDDVGWELVNDDTKADKWYIGSAVNNGGSKSLYISDDGGITNSYSENYDNVYAYRNFVVEEWGSYGISFDWRCFGEGTTYPYDYLVVYLAPASSAEPQAGVEPSSDWLQIGSIFNQVQEWQNYTTILDNVQPGAYRLIFRWRSDSSTQNDMPAAIDNVNVVKISCPAVASVTVDEESITPYSASISWEYSGDATDFIVVNAANTEETYEVSGETSFTIEDLIPNTQYTFKVYVNCGEEDISLPANVTFRTACAPIASLPFTEDFETVPSVSNPMPYCWTKYNTVSTGTYPYVTSNVTNAHNGQKYLYFYYSTSTGQPDYVMAILPELDPEVNSITNSQLSFWARTNSATGSFTLQIGTMSDPTDPETFELAEEKTITGNTYNRYDVAFYEAPEDNVYAVIRMNNPSAYASVYVDDVTLMEIPTCAYVNQNNIEVLGTTAHSVDVSWTDEENEDANYNIYDMSGEEPVLVVEGITLEDLPYTIDENVVEGGLASSTTFHYGLAAVCGGDVITDISDFYFTTECEAISVFPWTENFDSYAVGVFNAQCWVNEHIEGSSTYIFNVSQNVGGNTTKVLQLPDQQIGNMTKLVLPEMILPGDNYMLTLDMYRSSSTYNTSYPSEGIRVFVSTNGEIEGATELAFIPRHYSVGNSIIPTEEAEGWYNYELPIGVEGNCYIILRGESQYCTATYMDNLTVKQIPTCRQPNALAVSEIGPHQVTLSWTERGEATEWEVSYVPVGGNQSSNEEEEEVEEVVPAETNPFVLTGLDYETGYIVKVRANCGEDGEGELDLSEWSEPLTFTTAVACPNVDYTTIEVTPGPYSAYVTWHGNGVEDAVYDVYRYVSGQPQIEEEGVALPTAEEPLVIDNLDPETQYTFGVKPICEEGEASIVTFSFTTTEACPMPVNVEVEEFTSNDATISWTGFSDEYNVRYRQIAAATSLNVDFEDGMPEGWTTIDADGDGYNWDLMSNFGFSGTPHGGSDMIVSMSYYDESALTPDNYLVSPLVELGGTFSFWVAAQDASFAAEHFGVAVSTTTNEFTSSFTTVQEWTLGASSVTPTSGAKTMGDWMQVTVDLSAYEGQNGYVAIRHFNCSDMFYIDIDDITYLAPGAEEGGESVETEWVELTSSTNSIVLPNLTPATSYEVQVQGVCDEIVTEWTSAVSFTTTATCLPVTNLTATDITSTTVTLTWTDENGSATYVVTDGEGNELDAAFTENGCTVNGLQSNTNYTINVKTVCGEGDEGFAASVNIRTACGAIVELPWEDDFESMPSGSNPMPYCWTRYNDLTNGIYPYDIFGTPGDGTAHEGQRALSFYISTGTHPETIMAVTPAVDVEAVAQPMDNLQLSFWARGNGYGSTLQIGTMSDPTDAETFVLSEEVTVPADDEYVRYDVILANAPENNVYVAIRMDYQNTTTAVVIDDVKLMEAPLCTYVRDVETSNVSNTSVDVTWTDVINEEATYIIYNMNGEEGPEIVEPGLTLEDLPYTITDLEPSTAYTFGVQAMCSEDAPAEIITFDVTTADCAIAEQCDLTFVLTDAWGDSWNGAGIQLKDVATGNIIAVLANENLDGTQGSGQNETQTVTLGLCNGREIEFSWISGSYDSETSYSVTDANDDVILSGSGAFTTMTYTMNCSSCRRPSNLVASEISNHSFTVNWTETGTATSWTLAYKAEGETEFTEIPVDAPTYTFTELDAETIYTVKVLSNCDEEVVSSWSNAISCTTTVACPVPVITNVLPAANKVTVNWNGNGVEDATYNVYMINDGEQPQIINEEPIALADLPYIITGLEPETEYTYGVAANCGEVDGESQIVSFTFSTTDACPAVDEDNITVVPSTTSATVTWLDGNSDNATYIIYDMNGEEPVALFETPISINDLPYPISDLTANTEYTYGVKAICDGADPAELTITSFTFTTECDAIVVPSTEEFVSIDCWSQEGEGIWEVGTGDYYTSTGSYSGTTNALINSIDGEGGITKLISPVISNAENGMRLQFAYVMRDWYGDVDELRVYYRSSATDEWNQIGEYTEAVSTWTVETIDIANAVYQIAFEYTDNYGYGVGLDHVVFDAVPAYYTVNTPVNPVNAGTVTAADDVNLAAVLAGTSVTLTAEPATGYQFVNWTIGETTVTTNPYTFQVDEDMEITANFELIPVATYAVTLTYIETQGSVIANVENLQEIEAGTSVSLNAVPATGYQFVGWTVGETTITDNPYVFEITADMAITANFELIPATYAVTIATVENGFVSVSNDYTGDLDEVVEGTELTFIATALNGYQLAGWTVNGQPAQANEDGTLTVNIDADKTIAATFELIPVTTYSVNVTYIETQGTVTANVEDLTAVEAGTSVTLIATPATDYQFVGWTINGEVVATGLTYTFEVEADMAITATFELIPTTYTVTIATVENGFVTPDYTGNLAEVLEGTQIIFTATASTGYQFAGWTVNGEAAQANEDGTLTVTVEANITVAATFELIPVTTYNVSVNTSVGGSVTPIGNQTVVAGEGLTVTATPNTGYHFVAWMQGENLLSNDNPYTYYPEADNTSITATFEENATEDVYYSIMASANPTEGTVSANVALGQVLENTEVSITATPNAHYEFVNWIENGVVVSTANPYEFTATADRNLFAYFNHIVYDVDITWSPEMGTVTGLPEQDEFEEGDMFSLTATANTGYHFVNWTINNETVEGATTLVTVSGDMTIVANFAINTYAVNLVPATNGTVEYNVDDLSAVNHFTQVTFTATPNTGYHFVNWTINGETVEGESTTVTVSGEMTIMANFAINTYDVTLVPATNGTVGYNVDELSDVNYGTQIIFTATANEGYHFVNWTINGETVEGATTMVTVSGETTVEANFAINTYAVTVVANNGTVEANVEDLTAVNHYTQVTFTATPATGYELSGWTVNGVETEANIDGTLTITVTAPTTVAAVFTLKTYTVTLATVENGSIATAYDGDLTAVAHGTAMTFTATPAEGYQLEGWTVNGTAVTANPDGSLTVSVTANITVAATFTLIPPTTYTVTIATVQNGTISTTYTGDLTAVVAGTELTFTATPAQGYELSGWTVNGQAAQGTGNELTVTVNANITVAATFTLIPPTTYTVTIATVEHGTITANIDNLTAVVAGTEVTFTATPAQGYELSGWTVNGQAAQGTGNTLTVTVNANITVAATFTLIPPTTYTVTIATVEHGTISANIDNLTAVVAGTEVTFTATPAQGYELEGWTVNGQAAQGTGNTLTVTVNANITVAATFTAVAPNTIDVTFTVNDPNMGSINPSGTQTFTVGTQVTVTATANEGYEFYGWELTVNGVTTTLTENVETTYTVEALAEYDGLTVKALFQVKVGIDDVDMNNVTIYSAEDVIYVRGAEGRNVTVFDLNGRVLNQTAKAGEVCEFRMNNTGIYLVKVGTAAAKRVAVVR